MEPKSYELILPAKDEKLHEVLAFTDGLLEEYGCPIKAQKQIEIALEELFVNIGHYGYPEGNGEAKIIVTVTPEYAKITLIDSGIPYNPLAKPDPDVTLSAEERQIGGLGIFMSKKLMDDVSYTYTDRKNVMTIKKLFQ